MVGSERAHAFDAAASALTAKVRLMRSPELSRDEDCADNGRGTAIIAVVTRIASRTIFRFIKCCLRTTTTAMGFWFSPYSRRDRKLKEVFAQIFGETGFNPLVEEDATKLFARAQHFAPPVSAPPRIVGCEVEELERSCKGMLETFRAPLVVCAQDALHFTPDVAKLVHQRQSSPSPGRERGMVDLLGLGWCRHRAISVSTTVRIRDRTAGSSTPRVRLLAEGRTLIMDSAFGRCGACLLSSTVLKPEVPIPRVSGAVAR